MCLFQWTFFFAVQLRKFSKISQILQEDTCTGAFLGMQACRFIKKDTPTQVFSCESFLQKAGNQNAISNLEASPECTFKVGKECKIFNKIYVRFKLVTRVYMIEFPLWLKFKIRTKSFSNSLNKNQNIFQATRLNHTKTFFKLID